MRNVGLVALFAVVACGPAGKPGAAHPEPAAAARPYTVVSSQSLGAIAADTTHVYWVDGGISRRPHGPDGKAERLFATDDSIVYLAVGRDDVFFMNSDNVLRALPKTGGAPSELTTFDESVWALSADGDGVWVGVGDRLERWSREPGSRKVALGHTGTWLAIADGTAYVASYDPSTVVSVDLATNTTRTLLDAWYAGDATGIAVSGASVLLAYSGGVAAIPRDGGTPTLAFATAASQIAGDAAGYVVLESNAILDHHRGEAPRVIATSDMGMSVGAGMNLALTDAYAYHVDYDNLGGGYALRASPRGQGPTLLRIPLGATIADVGADGDRLYVDVEAVDGEQVLAVDARRSTVLGAAPAYVDRITAGDGAVAFGANGTLYAVDPATKSVVRRSNEGESTVPLAVHKGRIYTASYGQLYATPVAGVPRAMLVADASSLASDGDLQISSVEFGADHLYFVIPYGDHAGLVSVDEQRHMEVAWSYTNQDDSLATDFAIVDGVAYTHDRTHVYAVPLDGTGGARAVWSHDDAELAWIEGTAHHVVAWVRGPDGEELIEILPDTGKTHVLWRSYIDGGYGGAYDVGSNAVFLSSSELYGVLRIPVE